MSTAEAVTILGKLDRHVSSLQLSCAWEYSIAQNAAEIILLIGKCKIPQTSIYTNGNILTDEIAEALVAAQFNNFVFSIGEARKETYERLRKGGNFERVIGNIRKLSSLKQKRNSKFPKICANLTLVRSNIEELVEFVDLAYDLGIEEITGRHLILNKGLDMSGEMIQDKAHANSIIEEAAQRADGYGIKFLVPKYEQTQLQKSCRAPWQQLYISSNGDVSVCPRIHKYVKIGNLLTETLDEITRGKEMADLKRQFKTSNFANPVCAVCLDNRETESAIDQGF
jgi:radical SAM protein with 4Fe4S-binding SPASM domain